MRFRVRNRASRRGGSPPTRRSSSHWPSLASFKQRVPWPSVRRYFAVDEAFYEHVVEQEGSCIGHRAGHTALPASEGDWAMGVTWV